MATNLTDEQITIIRCAYADLIGARQARDMLNTELHDWKAHGDTINEMGVTFADILDVSTGVMP